MNQVLLTEPNGWPKKGPRFEDWVKGCIEERIHRLQKNPKAKKFVKALENVLASMECFDEWDMAAHLGRIDGDEV